MGKDDCKLRPFVEVAEGLVETHHIFSVRSDVVRSQMTGKEMPVDRLLVSDWVNVVALTEHQGVPSLLLVRQWRFGSRSFCDELPAGIVERGEDSKLAALRELREETGFAPKQSAKQSANGEAGDIVHLGQTRPNPAFMNNVVNSYLVPNAVKVSAPNLDATEELEQLFLPIDQIDDAIAEGRLNNALGLMALFRFRLWQQRHRSQQTSRNVSADK